MNKRIRVWDPLVRIFHWSLVLFFTVAYLTGEEEDDLHIITGYVVLGLIVFRLLWGFIGSRHARFNDFVTPPGVALEHLTGMLSGRSKRYVGHNPAGGWMILLLLATLFVVTLSGLEVYAIEEGKGPFAFGSPEIRFVAPAYADSDEHEEREHDGEHEAEEFWEEIHEASSNFMLLLILLHVGGVIVSGRLNRENLVKAMFTGCKDERTGDS